MQSSGNANHCMGDHCRGQLQNKVPREDDRIKLILFSLVPSVVLVSVAQFSDAVSSFSNGILVVGEVL